MSECSRGSYGDKCSTACSKYCTGGDCNHVTGFCKCASPANRHGGPRCDQPCPVNCGPEGCYQIKMWNYNKRTHYFKCRDCKPGWWGQECYQRCPEHCLLSDRVTHGCLQNSTGDCTLCKEGYHGFKCEEKCPSNCEGPCEKINGKCSCRAGTYGLNCDRNCSINCATEQCQKKDGHCICKPGYKTGCERGKYNKIIILFKES